MSIDILVARVKMQDMVVKNMKRQAANNIFQYTIMKVKSAWLPFQIGTVGKGSPWSKLIQPNCTAKNKVFQPIYKHGKNTQKKSYIEDIESKLFELDENHNVLDN